MPIAHTPQVILLDGPDAIAFAHGQFTSSVTALPVGQWQFSSWLDAQGRVRALFHLARLDEGRLLMLLRGGDAQHLVDGLRRFVFRSRVALSVVNDWKLGSGDAMSLHVVDVEHVEDGQDVIRLGCGSHAMQLGAHVVADDAWRLSQLHAGWPWLPDHALNEYLPPALSLHRLGAVALDKGCYPGQEIVARLHYRGGNKRHLYRVQLSHVAGAGIASHQSEQPFIQLLDAISRDEHTEALTVLPDDVAENIRKTPEKTWNEGINVHILDAWND